MQNTSKNVTAVYRSMNRDTFVGPEGTYVVSGEDRAVYVTQHSEYYCSNQTCIGVRSKDTSTWIQNHPACGKRLIGALIFQPEIGWQAEHVDPQVGDKIILANDLVTSTIEEIRSSTAEAMHHLHQAS